MTFLRRGRSASHAVTPAAASSADWADAADPNGWPKDDTRRASTGRRGRLRGFASGLRRAVTPSVDVAMVALWLTGPPR